MPQDNSASQPNQGCLQGIRVIDMTSVMMGPIATQTLGDMGTMIH
jgi:crotonobetainyl-CoA:carnitine CoA-transferase CaiB-like acyl-CoA transferase